MTIAILAYVAAAYWHFLMTLSHIQDYDEPETIILNASLALLVGPFALVLLVTLLIWERLYEH